MNFDNADLYEVVRMMADILKINFIIDQKVRGVVTIHSAGPIYREDIPPIFQSILKMNGATAVKKGILYEIVPFTDAKKMYTPPLAGRDRKNLGEEKFSVQIVPLKYIPAAEVTKLLKPFLSDGADLVEHAPTNIVIIGDIASNIQKALEIIDLFDVDVFADSRIRIYPILNADVNEVAKEMERIFASLEISTKSGRGVGITFTPVPRTNSLLAVSSVPQIFDKVEKWLRELDRVPAEGSKLSVFVYYVQNGKAKDMADVLKQVYQPGKGSEFRQRVTTPETPAGSRGVRPTPTQPAVPAATPSAAGARPEAAATGSVPEGEINIVVDETTNALIIRAYHRDYKTILETVKKLDLYPKQVLIEVLLAEVTLSDITKYGLE
ncbi:MAG: hypothetical protein NTY64_10950, partial [Deltaproteobacteria bacterium]|nr:hypothetical protein [Deltaproteobacteria bacterium]